MAWTDDRVELLKKLWADGLSASQIASKMGGVTRNAVIGKVHRLGLSGRATPAKPQLTRKTERPHKPEPRVFVDVDADTKTMISEPDFLEPLVLSTGDNATISTIKNNMCKWPIGDPSADDFHFCGQSTSHGKPYCAYHAHMAFQPSTTKRERKTPEYAIPAPKRAVG